MKKLFLGFVLIGMMSIAFPTIAMAEQPPCENVAIHCSNGTTMMGIICSADDLEFYTCYFCQHCLLSEP